MLGHVLPLVVATFFFVSQMNLNPHSTRMNRCLS
jgi:hypothetical protein